MTGPRLGDPRTKRREFLARAAAGLPIAALGGSWLISEEATAAPVGLGTRPDGRLRVPPGQRVLERLRPMGGRPGDPSRVNWKLKIYGEVKKPTEIDFRELLALPQVKPKLDVHCVTGWTVLAAAFEGVRLRDVLELAKPTVAARHVIFEAPGGYTANVRLGEVRGDDNIIAHRYEGRPFSETHGAPVRSIIPDLYFWKSTKWLTGIKLVARDERGYWEQRGYHNHADPWLEERYS